MRCSNCGCELIDGAKFCAECGTFIVRQERKIAFCDQCGKPLEEGKGECLYCREMAQTLQIEEEVQDISKVTKEEKKETPKIALGVAKKEENMKTILEAAKEEEMQADFEVVREEKQTVSEVSKEKEKTVLMKENIQEEAKTVFLEPAWMEKTKLEEETKGEWEVTLEELEVKETRIEKKFCPNCGKQIIGEKRFCAKCEAIFIKEERIKQERKKKIGMGIIIGLMIGILIIAFVVIIMIYFNFLRSDETIPTNDITVKNEASTNSQTEENTEQATSTQETTKQEEKKISKEDEKILETYFPKLPEEAKQQYYIIYQEESREKRLELAVFNIEGEVNDNYIAWTGPGNLIELHDPSVMRNCDQYYLDSNSSSWKEITKDYKYMSDFGYDVILSNIDVCDLKGELILQKNTYKEPLKDRVITYNDTYNYKRLTDIHNSTKTMEGEMVLMNIVIHNFNNNWVSYISTGDKKEELYHYVRKNTKAYDNIAKYKRKNIKERYELMDVQDVRKSNNYFYVWVHEIIIHEEENQESKKEYHWVYQIGEDIDGYYIIDYTADPAY